MFVDENGGNRHSSEVGKTDFLKASDLNIAQTRNQAKPVASQHSLALSLAPILRLTLEIPTITKVVAVLSAAPFFHGIMPDQVLPAVMRLLLEVIA